MSGEKLGGSSAGGDLYSGTLAGADNQNRCHAMLPCLLGLFGIQSASLSAHVHRRASAVGRAQGGDDGAGAGGQDGRLVQEGTRLTNSSTRESAQERLGMELVPPELGIRPTPGVDVVSDVADMLLHFPPQPVAADLPTTCCRGFWCVLGAY